MVSQAHSSARHRLPRRPRARDIQGLRKMDHRRRQLGLAHLKSPCPRPTDNKTPPPSHHLPRNPQSSKLPRGDPGGTLAESDRQGLAQIQHHVQEDAEPCSDDPSVFVSGFGHSRRQPTYIPAGTGLSIVVLGRGWGGYGWKKTFLSRKPHGGNSGLRTYWKLRARRQREGERDPQVGRAAAVKDAMLV